MLFLCLLRRSALVRIEPFVKLNWSSDVLDQMISLESNVGFTVVQCAALCREQGCNLWRRIPPSVCQVGFQSFVTAPRAQPGSFLAGNGEKFFSSAEHELGKLCKEEYIGFVQAEGMKEENDKSFHETYMKRKMK